MCIRSNHWSYWLAQVVVVDADSTSCGIIQHLLGPSHHVDHWRTPLPESTMASRPDVVILRLDQHEVDGLALLAQIRVRAGSVPIVALLDRLEVRRIVDAVQRGVSDVVARPIQLRDLQLAITRALARQQVARSALTAGEIPEIVGSSEPMLNLRRMIRVSASTDAPVLITGESGVGKELVAHAVHRLSAVSSGPFEVRNCGAIPDALLESELFGTERGAFTDAVRRAGAFEIAQGGTLFLDEIGELSVAAQAKLLRALETGTHRRVGGTSLQRSDARLVSATNRDLRVQMRKERFRPDLYYRIDVCRIHVPPLRERREDIPLLVRHFAQRLGSRTRDSRPVSFSDGALEQLSSHEWPGNVRELRNVVWRGIIAAETGWISADDLVFE